MFATFVIGLREGLEAALIVGIVAASITRGGTRRDLRNMWIGVAIAVGLCLIGAITLQVVAAGLPQRQQEMLECIIAGVAVVMVSFLIFWMRGHSQSLKADLESAAAQALAKGSALALVAMAALAVLREGFETSVFLLAALQTSGSALLAGAGAVAGIIVAVGLGYLIYRGAVRVNLAKFFRATGAILVLVAAGLVVKTFRAAYEAGWLHVGQQQVADVSGLIRPGSIQEALITGVLGIPARPVLIETLAWVLYVVPTLIVVLWPPRRLPAPATRLRAQAAAAAVAFLAAAAVLLTAPTAVGAPDRQDIAVSSGQNVVVTVSSHTSTSLVVSVGGDQLSLNASGADTVNGHDVTTYTASSPSAVPAGQPGTLTGTQIRDLRGGRYPVGLSQEDDASTFTPTYSAQREVRVDVDANGTILGYRDQTVIDAMVARTGGGSISLGQVGTSAVSTATSTYLSQAAARADEYASASARAQIQRYVIAPLLGGFAAVMAIFALAAYLKHLPVRRRVAAPDLRSTVTIGETRAH